MADWNWKVVHEFLEARYGIELRHSSCHHYLHHLGFVLKRPRKRLRKADATKRAAFVDAYASLRQEATERGATILFVDEAHFYADVDLRGKWVLKGEPAEVDSTCPRWGEKASDSSAIRLESGDVAAMALEGNSSAETSVAFLRSLRQVRGAARHHLGQQPGPRRRRLAHLPGHARPGHPPRPLAGVQPRLQRRRGHLGLDPRGGHRQHLLRDQGKVQAAVDRFFQEVAARTAEVKQRCRSALQAAADTLTADQDACYVDPIAV